MASGRSPEEAVEALLAAFAAEHSGVDCECEMAGDWNSLGIAVAIPAESTPRETMELRNALVARLAELHAARPLPFTWSGGLYRGGELVATIDPRSRLQRMCAMCGKTQEEGLVTYCLACHTPGLW